MSDPAVFEAPCQTLFVLEAGRLRILTCDGGEAAFPASDLEAFLRFLATRSPAPETPPEAGVL